MTRREWAAWVIVLVLSTIAVMLVSMLAATLIHSI